MIGDYRLQDLMKQQYLQLARGVRGAFSCVRVSVRIWRILYEILRATTATISSLTLCEETCRYALDEGQEQNLGSHHVFLPLFPKLFNSYCFDYLRFPSFAFLKTLITAQAETASECTP
jgi:hypothetical protein